MAPYNPYWVEEPVYPPEDFETCARIRKSTGVPLGMGENVTSLNDFRTMVATGAADFVQPSIVKIGGITAMMKVAREVGSRGRGVRAERASMSGRATSRRCTAWR